MFEELITSPFLIMLVFFSVAFFYSSVGLGGGSSYSALLALSGMHYLTIPVISLLLNLLVSTAGAINFIRNGHAQIKLIAPFLITSVPMAYVGGSINVSPDIFYLLLLISLLIVAARIYLWQEISLRLTLGKTGRILVPLVSGTILGLIAGIVGIGGGIYLIPLILIFGLGTEKQAAASAVIMVWLNSITGLLARLQHQSIDIEAYLPLCAAVLAGGFIGSYMGSFSLSPKTMEKILGGIVLLAIVFLTNKIIIIAAPVTASM